MRNIIVTASFCLFAFGLSAQDSKLEIIPMAGYTFSGQTSWGTADMDLKDNYSAGLAMDIRVEQSTLVELSYQTVSTNLNTIVYNSLYGRLYYDTPVQVSYYQLGGIREFSNDKVRPFTTASLGATLFHPTGETVGGSEKGNGNPEQINNSDLWAFSATLGGGAKIMFSDRIGLRLQGKLLLPMYFSGVGIYCGGGCGGGATFGVYFLQLDLSGGLIISLGDY